MGILKNILITLFGKSKKEEVFKRDGSIDEVPMKFVYKKTVISGKIGGYVSGDTEPDKSKSCSYKDVTHTFCEPNFTPRSHGVCNPPAIIPNGDDFFVSNDLIEKETKTDAKAISLIQKEKKQRVKSIIGKLTLAEIKEYLHTYGSLDVLTCQQKFNVKSLHNFIWYLRKEGLIIKTEKVGLHNELGEKVLVTNYRLISSN